MAPSEEPFLTSILPSRASVPLGSRETVLALRLFALAVGCACGCLVESVIASPAPFISTIVTGALLTLLQHGLLRRAPRVAGPVLLLPHVAVWTALVLTSGGATSPLIFGYLFEVPLAGMLMGRAGALWAGAAGAVAFAVVSRAGGPHAPWPLVVAAIGFIGIACLLTSWLVGVIDRQRLEIASSHERLRRRADGMADELRLLGDYMSGGLVTIDELGRVIALNPAAATILTTSESAARGHAWQEVMRPEGAGCADLAAALTSTQGARQLRLLLSPASERPIAVVADVWTRETREGTRTYVLLDPATEPAEGDPLRRLGEGAASVSHQIKNSLHALQGFALDISPGSGDRPGKRSAAEQLHHALGTLGELAEDVLAMSGAPRAEELIALPGVLASAVLLTRRDGIEIIVRGGLAGDVRVRAHRGKLVHSLFNLIDNACRASARGDSVEVSLGACDDLAWIEICDRGPGMPSEGINPAAVAHAPFGARPAGNGLGLVATRRFLESFGARLECFPREGGGSRCRIVMARSGIAVRAEAVYA